MEIRMEIDNDTMNYLKRMLKLKKGVDVISNAVTILNWAVGELEHGRIILSSDKGGGNVRVLAMPDLDKVSLGKHDTTREMH